jgi:hypothetical protein
MINVASGIESDLFLELRHLVGIFSTLELLHGSVIIIYICLMMFLVMYFQKLFADNRGQLVVVVVQVGQASRRAVFSELSSQHFKY